jgi:hypothetical protein
VHAFPAAYIPKKTMEGFNPPSLPTMLTHCLCANRCHLLREITKKKTRYHTATRTAHPAYLSLGLSGDARAQHEAFRPLSPTATHGLLLKPSFLARRHHGDVSVCVYIRMDGMHALGGVGLSWGRT